MKLEEIQSEWADDARISPTDLGSASLSSSLLHSKYWKILSAERLNLRALEFKLKETQANRFRFYDGTIERELLEELEWLDEYKAFNLKVLKTDIPRHLETDKYVVPIAQKIVVAKEKVDFLESIIRRIDNMNFQISNAIKFQIFQAGG